MPEPTLYRLEQMASAANEAELRWMLGEWLTELKRQPETETDALTMAAAWVAESIGYPVEVKMPDHPMPQALWDALVDHIHADESGRWHGNELDRESTEWWLADEAGRDDMPTSHHPRNDETTESEGNR